MEVKWLRKQVFKRILVVVLTIAMLAEGVIYTPAPGGSVKAATIWNGYVATSYEAGTGTKDNPYQIKWGSQLAYLAENVMNGETYAGKYFVLTSDIELNDTDISSKLWSSWNASTTGLNSWSAIGSYTDAENSKPFAGNFNGEDHVVRGIWSCNRLTNGLFGYNTGTIKNLNIEKSYIEGSGYGVGSIAGKNDGTILQCSNGATVVSVWADENNIEAGSAGGIAGTNGGVISQGTNNGKVDGVGVTGGVTGTNLMQVVNCVNTGKIGSNVQSQYGTGGVAGCNCKAESSVENSYNTGNIKAVNYAGGIIGTNVGIVTNSYNTGNVEVTQSGGTLGAIAGILERSMFTSSGSIAYSYWKSDIALKSAADYIAITGPVQTAGTGTVDSASCYQFNSSFELQNDSNTTQDITFNIDGNSTSKSILAEVLDSWTQARNCGAKDSSYLRWTADSTGAVFAKAEADTWTGNAASSYGGGDGSEGSPYRITNGDQLKYFANQVNGGNSYSGDYFVLTSDIRLNDETFTYDVDTGLIFIDDGINNAYLGTGVAGNSSGSNTQFDSTASVRNTYYRYNEGSYTTSTYGGLINSWTPVGTASKSFAGNFNGKGFSISGLYVDSYLYTGLFGYVDGSNICNLNIQNSCFISADSGYVSSLAGYFEGYISRCSSSALIIASAADYVGGLAGYMADSVLDSDGSYLNCNKVFGSHYDGIMTASGCAGGLVGYTGFGGIMDECYLDALARLSGKGNCLGGLVGKNYGTSIINSYSLGTVESMPNGIKYIGGIAGENASEGSSCIAGFADVFGKIINCYSRAKVTGMVGSYTGGIVGYNKGGSINNTYCDSSVTGGSFASIAGVNGISEGEYTLYEGLTKQKYKSCSGEIHYSYGVNKACNIDNSDETHVPPYVDENSLFPSAQYAISPAQFNETKVIKALNLWITTASFGNDAMNSTYLAWSTAPGGYPTLSGTHFTVTTDNEPLPEYQLIYNGNDENVEGNMSAVTYEMTLDGAADNTLPVVEDNAFTNEGYNFVEWNTESDGSGDTYHPGDRIRIKHTTNLYAIWISTQAVITDVNRTGNSATITWAAVDDASGYWIYRYKLVDDHDVFTSFASGDKVSEILVPASGAPASYSYTDDNLSEGTYYYGIRAYSVKNAGSTTATYVFKPFSTAEEVVVDANTITYNGNGNDGGVAVPAGGFVNDTEALIADNTFTYTGHSFVEWNTNSDGSGTSYHEGDKFVITEDKELYAIWEITPIDNLKVELNLNDRAVLSWNPSSAAEASGYNVYCSIGDTTHYSLIASVQGKASDKYITDALNPGTVYNYKITVFQASSLGSGTYSEESTYSNEVSIKSDATLQLDNTKGKLEEGIHTGIDGKKVYLRWEAQSGVTGYQIYRSTKIDEHGTCVGSVTGYDTTTFEDEVVVEGIYYYRVKAFTEVHGAGTEVEQVNYSSYSKALPVEIKTVIITFDSNEGLASQKRIQTTGKNFICMLNENQFTRQNFTFTGWNTSADLTGTAYSQVAECSFSDSITLYASWKLNAPVNLAASILGNTLTISWDTNTSASGYQIYQKMDNGNYEMLGNVGTVEDPSVKRVIPDIVLSSSYNYYVTAFILNTLTSGDVVTRYSDKSEIITVQPSPVPQGLVTNLQAEINPDRNDGSKVKLTWQAVDGAAGYHVYRSTSKLSYGEKISDVSLASYIDTSIKAAEPGPYYYWVRAYVEDVNGVYYKDYSEACEVAFDTIDITYLPNGGVGEPVIYKIIKGAAGVQVSDCTFINDGYSFAEWYLTLGQSEKAYKVDIDENGNNEIINADLLNSNMTLYARWKLNKVVNVTTELTETNKVSLSWDSIVNSTGYSIYQRKGVNGSFECIGSTTSTSFVGGETLDPTSTYYYYVAAYVDIELVSGKLKSEGMPSDIAIVEANSGSYQEGQVTGLAAEINCDDVTLTWDKVDGVDGYYIYRSSVENERGECIATVKPSDVISYTDQNVTEVATYYYSARAFIETDSAMFYKPWSAYTSVTFEECTIKYVANNGTDTVNEIHAITGADVLIAQNSFMYSGRCFIGWNEDPLGKGYGYNAGQTFSVNKDITLYAIWKLEKPSGIKAVLNPSHHEINLSWDTVVGATGYMIYKKIGDNGEIEECGTTTDTVYTDFNDGKEIVKDDVFYYFVRAYETIDSNTRRFSDYSELVADCVIGNGSVPTREPVGRVSNLSLLNYNKDTAKIGWSGIPAADGYYIYYSEGIDGEKKYAGLDTIGSNIETMPLTLDTQYYYYVVAYIIDSVSKAYIMGDYSEGLQVMVTSTPAPTATPTAPPTASPNPLGRINNLQAEVQSANSLKLTWDSMHGITSYRVYSVENDAGDNPVKLKDVTETELTIDNLIPGRTYYYKVSGYNTVVGSGIIFSDSSDVVSVLMVFATPKPSCTPVPTQSPKPTQSPNETARPSGTPDLSSAAPSQSPAVESAQPSVDPSAKPTSQPSKSPTATPAPTKKPVDETKVTNVLITDAYSEYINLVWNSVKNAKGYEVSYSTSLTGKKTVLAVTKASEVSCSGLAVTGAAFVVNEEINANGIQAYNQNITANYYIFVRAILADGYGTYSDSISIELTQANIASPSPIPTPIVTPTKVPDIISKAVTPTPKPTDKPVVVGSKATVGKLTYGVTSVTTTGGKVKVLKPVKKTYASLTIPATVKISGKTYKVTAINASAFANNKKLKSIVIGKNIKSLGKKAFYNCKKMKQINFKTKVLKTVGKKAFHGIKKNCKFIIQKAVLSKYKKLMKNKK